MKKFLASLALVSTVLILGGCKPQDPVKFAMPEKEHKVLIVIFSKNPSGLAADPVYIRKAMENGGLIRLNADTVRNLDPEWSKKYDTTDNEGSFLVLPMVLNWVSSKGWKLQTVFCINLNEDNKEFYFVK